MPTVISVENISKKYIIGHQKQERYTALRDILTEGAKRIARRMIHPIVTPVSDPSHEEFWALKDVSFDIQQGDRIGIIGRNGAGKSTLLKVLSRITEPTMGKVSIKGRVASLLEVGTGFHPELTGRENIFLNGAILGMSKVEIKRKFDEIVAFAEIEMFLDTPVKRYSSGMYVRLAFAVAAHLETEILIVDEVLAVGDAEFQRKCLGKMEDVGKDGRTVLFVSHNMAAISRLCTRCVYLDHGKVVNIGSTQAVMESYVNAGFPCQSGEVIFPSGENKEVQFISASTVGAEGVSKSSFRSNEDIHIVLTYQVKRQLSGVDVALSILAADQTVLWYTLDWEEYPELLDKREPGIWTCEWIIPANFFKPDRYFIRFSSASHLDYYHLPDPFAFEITSEGTQRPLYLRSGPKGGPIALKMRVKSNALPEKEN